MSILSPIFRVLVDLTEVRLPVAIWAESDCIFDGVIPAFGQRDPVMHLEIGRVVACSLERRILLATLAAAIGTIENFSNNVGVSVKDLSRKYEDFWFFRS